MLGGCLQNDSLTLQDIQSLVMSRRLDPVLCDTALLSTVDLRQLKTDDQRLCFYGNLLNLMLLHAFTVCCAVRLLQVLFLHFIQSVTL